MVLGHRLICFTPHLSLISGPNDFDTPVANYRPEHEVGIDWATIIDGYIPASLIHPLQPTDRRFPPEPKHVEDSLVYLTWFRGGLRIVDIADPLKPREVGYFIPAPGKGQKAPQSNDVFVDGQGMIYLIDRLNGLDILEYTGPGGQQAAA